MVKIGVVLSGCGFLDGSEIHEATLSLYFLDRAGAEVVCFAPNVAQHDVVDHAAGKPTSEQRNSLVEAARIARGKIADVALAKAAELDALVLPGGYGAAKNLCDFAFNGGRAKVHEGVARLLREMHAAKKPIGAICIAPAVVAATFRGTGTAPKLTIGNHAATAQQIEAMGARHSNCPVDSFCVDEENRIVTAPAYMYDARISQVGAGIEKLISEVLRLAASKPGLARSTR
jgi:enhancing lycopene biosynthesis protein 2